MAPVRSSTVGRSTVPSDPHHGYRIALIWDVRGEYLL